jgi:ribosome maturation factor RimP
MVGKPGQPEDELLRLAEGVLERLGFELVEMERVGHRARPILRLRIDRPDWEPGRGVTVDECAQVSRELEATLDRLEELAGGYIIEVSSPGVDRPLHKRRDFERSVGREIAVRLREAQADGSRRIEGVLVSVEGEAGEERLRLRQANGAEVETPFSAIAGANLVFRWGAGSRKSRGRRS